MPLPRTMYIEQQLPKPVRIGDYIDTVSYIPEEDLKEMVAPKIGMALLEAGLINFRHTREITPGGEMHRCYGSVMAIKQDSNWQS